MMDHARAVLVLIPLLSSALGGCGTACLPPCEPVYDWFDACLAPAADLQRYVSVPEAEMLTVTGSVVETGEGVPSENCFEDQTTLGGDVTDGSSPTSWMKIDDGTEIWTVAVRDKSITLPIAAGDAVGIKYWAHPVGFELTGGELLLERSGEPALYLGRHSGPERLGLLASVTFTTGARDCGSSHSCGDTFGHLLEVEYGGERMEIPRHEPTAVGELTFENRGIHSSQSSLITVCYDWGGGSAAVAAYAR